MTMLMVLVLGFVIGMVVSEMVHDRADIWQFRYWPSNFLPQRKRPYGRRRFTTRKMPN